MNDLHLRDLIGGFVIPVVLFLAVLTLPKWGPHVAAWWDRLLWRAGGPSEAPASPRTTLIAGGPPQQDQVRTDQAENFESVLEWVSEHNVTDEQALLLLAKLRRAPDDYIVSANKIRDSLGGSRDEILSKVSALRPRAPQKPSARLDRPPNGWRSAS